MAETLIEDDVYICWPGTLNRIDSDELRAGRGRAGSQAAGSFRSQLRGAMLVDFDDFIVHCEEWMGPIDTWGRWLIAHTIFESGDNTSQALALIENVKAVRRSQAVNADPPMVSTELSSGSFLVDSDLATLGRLKHLLQETDPAKIYDPENTLPFYQKLVEDLSTEDPEFVDWLSQETASGETLGSELYQAVEYIRAAISIDIRKGIGRGRRTLTGAISHTIKHVFGEVTQFHEESAKVEHQMRQAYPGSEWDIPLAGGPILQGIDADRAFEKFWPSFGAICRYPTVMVEETVEFLSSLVNGGQALVMLTSGPLKQQCQQLDDVDHSIRRLFELIVVVPEKTPAFYDAALRLLGVPVARALMIGNSVVSDVVNAIKAGLKAVLIIGLGTQHFEDAEVPEGAHVTHKSDLLADRALDSTIGMRAGGADATTRTIMRWAEGRSRNPGTAPTGP